MTKDDFQDNSQKGKEGKAGTGTTSVPTHQIRPAPPGPRPPAPKPPFGMPAMPVAVKVKILPPVPEIIKKEESSLQQSPKDEK